MFVINQLLRLESANFKPGSAEEKAKIYYESCLDRNDTVESRGKKPMQDLIESVSLPVADRRLKAVYDVNSCASTHSA